jgi:TRAP-type mannitol/chloroaromatic compound transport system substrate-binding protein
VNNNASGMYKVAKYPIYPGIHSMAVLQFIVNKDVWDKLSEAEQTALEVWYIAAYTTMRRSADMEDKKLAAMQREGGDVTVVDWAQEERDKFRAIAVGAWTDFGAKSELATEALEANMSFMKTMGMLEE